MIKNCSCIKIFRKEITIIVPWVKRQNRTNQCSCTIHTIFIVNLSFFEDTMRIISCANNFIRVQYLIILCF
jgi:hypothetical protein